MRIAYSILGVLVATGMAFGYYAISPLFRNVKVDEAAPAATTNRQIAAQQQGLSPASVATGAAEVTGMLGRPASGTARILEADGKKYLRYENFTTINGPDIYIYLSKDLDAIEFVNLGPVKATEGNINYEIPGDIDPRLYPYALVWSKAFGVLFNSAKLY